MQIGNRTQSFEW